MQREWTHWDKEAWLTLCFTANLVLNWHVMLDDELSLQSHHAFMAVT